MTRRCFLAFAILTSPAFALDPPQINGSGAPVITGFHAVYLSQSNGVARYRVTGRASLGNIRQGLICEGQAGCISGQVVFTDQDGWFNFYCDVSAPAVARVRVYAAPNYPFGNYATDFCVVGGP